MTSTAQRRFRAGLVDLALMVVWAVLVGLVALALLTGGALGGVGPLGLNLTGLAAVVLPVTIGLTVLEAGRYEATPGKLKLGLRVRHDPGGERISWGRSFLRNLLKLGLPWLLLHLAVITAMIGGGGVAAWIGFLLAVAVPVAYLVSLYRGDGRTIYDHLAGTMVISTAPGRRFAPAEPVQDEQPQAEPERPATGDQPVGEPAEEEQEPPAGHQPVEEPPVVDLPVEQPLEDEVSMDDLLLAESPEEEDR